MMPLISKCFILIITFFTLTLNAQIESLIPIHSDPGYLINQEGKIMASLPKGEQIVSSPEGKSGAWWSDSAEIGTCGNIVTFNHETQVHSLFDINGKRKKTFSKKYSNVSTCNEGFHLATVKEKSDYGFFNSRFVFLDKMGQVIFNPKGFQKADYFNEGLAAVLNQEKKWVYINDLGHELDIIPKSIEGIRNVTSFYNNVSIITTNILDNTKRGTYQVYMINREGEILFDSQKSFSDTPVKRVSRVQGGITTLTLYVEDYEKGERLLYVNNKGEAVLQSDHELSLRHRKSDYIFTSYSNGIKPTNALFTPDGKKVLIPKLENKDYIQIRPINDQYYRIYYKLEEKKYHSTVFDVKKGKNVYRLKDDVIAIKGDLISLKNMSNKRYYVKNMFTDEIVYDTKVSDQRFYNIPKDDEIASQIETYVCREIEDVSDLHRLTGVRELTIGIKDLENLPDLSKLVELKVLRIDDCQKLKEFPVYLNNLSQLSLRNCIDATNVVEMVDAQINLENLFLINFDISESDKKRLQTRYPKSRISGDPKYASSSLQESIRGF